jgi:hypothetical protein
MTEFDNVLGRMREVLDGRKTAQAIEAVRERAREEPIDAPALLPS